MAQDGGGQREPQSSSPGGPKSSSSSGERFLSTAASLLQYASSLWREFSQGGGGRGEPQSSTSSKPQSPSPSAEQIPQSLGERILNIGGRLLLGASIFVFLAGGVEIFQAVQPGPKPDPTTWLALVQQHSATLTLLAMAFVAGTLGRRVLSMVRSPESRSIPSEDLQLVSEAVKQGKSEPIDEYVRLRSLSGVSGTFTKLGVTGLPLTTVFLTLVFSLLSLLPPNFKTPNQFLDLAKLTLGAFIGSFVQRQVEQRKQEGSTPGGVPRPPPIV